MGRTDPSAETIAPPRSRVEGGRLRPVVIQFARFVVVGGISFAVDYGLFLLLHQVVGVQYILASTISFSVSLVLNYVLTLRYVFTVREGRNVAAEFAFYVGLNLVALGLNQIILFVTVDNLGLTPAIGKVVATAVVLVYNFISRKLLLERRRPRRERAPDTIHQTTKEQHG